MAVIVITVTCVFTGDAQEETDESEATVEEVHISIAIMIQFTTLLSISAHL